MDIYLLIILLLCIIPNKFYLKEYNDDYLSKENTSSIKGIFILLIFFSHSLSYVSYNEYSFIINKFVLIFGQLVVTMFLFYSGYGIFESYKNKGKEYIHNFPKKRILKTLINFDLVVILYLILYFIINKNIPIKQTIFSFIGWDSLGNSNWYIFDILVLYGISYFSFKIFNNKKYILIFNWTLSILFILFLMLYKQDWWYNTILCFPFGMTYSYFKDKINIILKDNKKYLIIILLTIISTYILRRYSNINNFYYEIYAILFSLFVVLLSRKIIFKNKILKFFGDNLFWIYILQRFPMIILSNYFQFNSYLFFVISFISTIILTILIKQFISLIDLKKLK